MRGQAMAIGSVEVLTRALREEFPELDPVRLTAAVERAIAKVAAASLDTEGYKVVDLHLQRVEATEEATERAAILRELSETLEQRGDADRGLVTRLAAFGEAAAAADILPLLRLARITDRVSELPLEKMSALIDINDEAAAQRLNAMAEAWQKVGRAYYAADCFERVLLITPADQRAHETLEVFYRSNGEWPVLIDLLSRRTVHVETDRERAELYREIALIYEREIHDENGALDAYREADRLQPDNAEVLDAVVRLSTKLSVPEEEVLSALERSANVEKDPVTRARTLTRAAEIAKLHDWDKAQRLYERARIDDPDLVPAIDGLVHLLRDRGELPGAINLLRDAAGRPALSAERARWFADAGDYRVGLGDFDEAKAFYRAAREADPNSRAGQALVELCWDTGSLVELAPILDELCQTTDDPERLRSYLVLRSKVALELGERSAARLTLARVVDLDPSDSASRRELADLLFDNQEWARARPLIEGILDEQEEQLPLDVCVELHYRIARCAQQLGDSAAATKHSGIALALQPEHRPSLLLRAEVDAEDPESLLAHQLTLANTAPVEERASRFAALGDRYNERGDRATAREMYREALRYKPTDHLLLTKSLTLVADEGDWSYSLDLLTRLIDTENDPKVRARYRHTAAMISRDEMDDTEQTITLLKKALEDDPFNFTIADDLEALHTEKSPRDRLVRFYYRRLDHVRNEEGRAGERLRLWDKLGELLLKLDRTEDALLALEVALKLDPDNLERRIKLADLFAEADPKHAMSAIVQHQAVLRSDKRRATSYEALRTLYARTDQPEKARACDEALSVLNDYVLDAKVDPGQQKDGVHLPGVTNRRESQPKVADDPPRVRTLANEDWIALSRLDVDLRLSALFALVAPPFAAERARVRPPPTLPDHEHTLPPLVAKVLAQVLQSFGIPRPPIFIDRDQLALCRVSMGVRGGVLVPVLIIGQPSVGGGVDELELCFMMARQLADLRNDRIARLLCPRAGELAQIIELALTPAGTATPSGRWLSASLHPMELDQVRAVGARLREKQVHPMSAAVTWLSATDRAADRIGFTVVGKLAPCARVLEREPQASANDLSRVLELIWASITEEVLAVRGRVEGWSTAQRRSSPTIASVS